MLRLKVIQLYSNQEKLVKKAIGQNREAQKLLFEKHAPKMLSVCRQYINDIHYAEDVMIEAFAKVFKNLHTFRNEGSLEGWIRRIMVRECLSFLRRNKKMELVTEITDQVQAETGNTFEAELAVGEIQQLLDMLPEGYRTVFVMYAVEGYKHHEIAQELGISEGTSKSQLFKARKLLQQNYLQLNTQVKWR